MSADPVQTTIDYSLHPEDRERIATQQRKVSRFMQDHPNVWFTPKEVRLALGFDEDTAVTARLRAMRTPKGGAFNVESKRIRGAWRYRLVNEHSKQEPSND